MKRSNSRVVLLKCVTPVARSVTVTWNICSIPPSNPGMHWRWNVSDDLFMMVQLETGSGATKEIWGIQE